MHLFATVTAEQALSGGKEAYFEATKKSEAREVPGTAAD